MYSSGCKLIRVGWVVHFWLINDAYFVCLEELTMLVNDPINIFFDKLKHYFTLFITIKYWWILRMSNFLTEPWSSEKRYIVTFKESSLSSSFVKSFGILPKQKSYQLMLSSFFTCK